MFYGFQWYAGVSQAWTRMKLVPKILSAPPAALFFLCDVLWNCTWGTVTFLEFPFVHGFTFSQRVEYWANQSGWRKDYVLGATNWKSLLNSILPYHIL